MLDADEGAGFSDVRLRASQFFNRLLEAQWLHQRVVALGGYQVFITPALRWTVRLLRELGKNDPTDRVAGNDVERVIIERMP